MGRFYKATMLDGRIRNDETLCEVGKTLMVENGSRHTLWAFDAPGEAVEVQSWPCRLFLVEGEPVASNGHTHGFCELSVVEELPAWQALGPNGKQVAALIVRSYGLTPEKAAGLHYEISLVRQWDKGDALFEAWHRAQTAASASGRRAAVNAADVAVQDACHPQARAAARNAALALVTWDLATEEGPYTIEHRDILYGPWKKTVEKAQELNPGPGDLRMRMR